MTRQGGWPLLGRDQELAVALSALNGDAASGVVATGVAGVGKSHLVRETIARMRARGAATEWVSATRAAATIPFGAVAHLLAGDDRPATDPLQLFRSAGAYLAARAGGARLVIGVDDAHLLDPGSAALVSQLVIGGTASVAVSVRSGEPCPDSIVALWKDCYCVRLDLQALRDEEIAALVEAQLAGPVDADTTRWIVRSSGGIPLYVRELIAGALQSGTLAVVDGWWRLTGDPGPSARLVDLVGGNLAELDGPERRIVELLAVHEPLGLGLLETLVPRGDVAALERRGLVVTAVDGRRVEVRLTQPLYGEIVARQLPPSVTRYLRRELAAALRESGARRSGDVLRLAAWQLSDDGPADAELLTRAAAEANRAFDHVLAARLARAAMDAAPDAHPDADVTVPAALELAAAAARLGRFDEVETALAPVEGRTGDEEKAVDYLFRRVSTLTWALGRAAEARALLDRAAQWWVTPTWQHTVQAFRVLLLFDEGRVAAAVDLGAPLVAAAGLDARTLFLTSVAASVSLTFAGRTVEGQVIADRLLEPLLHAEQVNRDAAWSALQAWWGVREWSGRDWDGVEPVLQRLYGDATGQGDVELAATTEMALGCLALARGRVLDARRWLRDASLHLEASDPHQVLVYCLATLCRAQAVGADVAAAEATRERARAAAATRPGYWVNQLQLAVADVWIAAARGDAASAQEIALRTADSCREDLLHRAMALHEAVRVGAPATRVAGPLREVAERTDSELTRALADHVDALAASDAVGLDRAAADLASIGTLLIAAEAAAHAATAHRAAGRKVAASESAARSARLARACQGARTPTLTPQRQVRLTAREREVAVLAAQGVTNRDIAARLHLSVRTVESHLYRATAKLGVSRREDLSPLLDG